MTKTFQEIRAESDFVTLGYEYDNAQRELDGMTIWQIHNTDRGHFLMDRVAELRSQWNGAA